MRLIAAAKKKQKIKGAFFVYSDDGDLKSLSSGKKFYPYVGSDGTFDMFGGVFKEASSDLYRHKSSARFKDAASGGVFKIAPAEYGEVFSLRGSRINPSYLEISRVTKKDIGETKGMLIEGEMFNVYDPRLNYLGPNEDTAFGAGSFDIDKVFALHDGSYFYEVDAPFKDDIKKIVEEQKELFARFGEDPNNKAIKKALDATTSLLRPHAGEVYDREDDILYYIGHDGKWYATDVSGNRPIDIFDKKNILDYVKSNGLLTKTSEEDRKVRRLRENIGNRSLYERFSMETMGPAYANALKTQAEKIETDVLAEIKGRAEVRPTDAVASTIPGLKEGVQFPGHQSYILGKLAKANRMLVDADPGAGKSPIQIADILNQLALAKAKRPLVVVPGYLVNDFAQEVRRFSELNPWIINTTSIKKWKGGTLEGLLEDAKKAPENTVFITSYQWLAKDKKKIPNGRVTKANKYGNIKVFENPYKLLKDLQVDAVYMDEVQLLRNDSTWTRAASVLAKVPIVRGLTGTIMPGNLFDVRGPMGFIHSGIFKTKDDFLDRYSKNGTINNYKDGTPKQIREALQRFGVPQVRRSAWATMVPKKHRHYHFVHFNKNQEDAYNALLKASVEEINKNPELKRAFAKFRSALEDGQVIMNSALRARFTPLEKFLTAPAKAQEFLEATLNGDDRVSPKMREINRIVSEHLAQSGAGKVLIYTQYVSGAEAIFDNLDPSVKEKAAWYKAGKIDVLNRFMNPESDLKVLVGVDKTLTLGKNLQVADTIIHADTLWLSGDMDQRESRAARYGQTREVNVHHIIVANSGELLKTARNLSQQHLIAKANSNFADKTVLPSIEMTGKAMEEFRNIDDLKPFIDRQKVVEKFHEDQVEQDKEFFGGRLLSPNKYTPVITGNKLDVVPSTIGFKGNSNASEFLVAEELEGLPDKPEKPHLLKFNLMRVNDRWRLTCFRVADPQGFVRRLGFSLQAPYYYIEVGKGGISQIISDIEGKGIEILNKEALEQSIGDPSITKVGRKGILKQLEKQSRTSIMGKKEAEAKTSLEFKFVTIDTFPFVYTDNVRPNTPAAQSLIGLKFKQGPSYWYLPTTKSKMPALFKRIEHTFPDLKIADFDEFKALVKRVFKVDLEQFKQLGDVAA